MIIQRIVLAGEGIDCLVRDTGSSTLVTSGRKAGQKKLRVYLRSYGQQHQREPLTFYLKPTWLFLNIAFRDRVVMCDAQNKCGLCIIRKTKEKLISSFPDTSWPSYTSCFRDHTDIHCHFQSPRSHLTISIWAETASCLLILLLLF